MKGKKRVNRFRSAKKADWKGIKFISANVGCQNSLYEHNGYHYCTLGEMLLAEMLTEHDVGFIPDMRFRVKNDGKFLNSDGSVRTTPLGFVPDFIFNGDEWIWTEEDGIEFVIHGIEAKASDKKPERARLLYDQRGIHVMVMSDAEIGLYAKKGGLPLKLKRRKPHRKKKKKE
ncbi:MAG: hypothetical protein U9Q03_03815 [Patescibacteria group bacterium]|nr:hypothetical protein [Patescibacteria group bacterium]